MWRTARSSSILLTKKSISMGRSDPLVNYCYATCPYRSKFHLVFLTGPSDRTQTAYFKITRIAWKLIYLSYEVIILNVSRMKNISTLSSTSVFTHISVSDQIKRKPKSELNNPYIGFFCLDEMCNKFLCSLLYLLLLEPLSKKKHEGREIGAQF